MSDVDSARGSVDPSQPKDRHEPRGRKPNDHLPPSRAREVQRAFRLRRAEHLASLEERINLLESENTQLRALLNLPEADRPRIGSGPTGKGKALKEGGVPMSERVRARKEARERERRAKAGLPMDAELSSEASESVSGVDHMPGGGGGGRGGRDSQTLSPRATTSATPQLPLFNHPPADSSASFNYALPMPFNLPVSPDPGFPDFTNSLDSMFKNTSNPGSTPNFGNLFGMFTEDAGPSDPLSHQSQSQSQNQNQTQNQNTNPNPNSNSLQLRSHPQPQPPPSARRQSPMSPPTTIPQNAPQPDLLTRLKVCCHLSDSHVVNDPGLLIFATRLCQSFPCQFSGVHPEITHGNDPEHLMLEESWRALKAQLDPGGEADGENRINTGRMAAELVIRAAGSRGPGNWIVCRYREGMSVKRGVVVGLVQGLGGKFD